jgi:hypothetical protein
MLSRVAAQHSTGWKHIVIPRGGIERIKDPNGDTSEKERCHEVAGLIVLRSSEYALF